MGEGISLGNIFFIGITCCLTFLSKHLKCLKTPFQLERYLSDDANVNLVVKKIIDFQDIPRLNHSVANYFLFKKVHILLIKVSYIMCSLYHEY